MAVSISTSLRISFSGIVVRYTDCVYFIYFYLFIYIPYNEIT